MGRSEILWYVITLILLISLSTTLPFSTEDFSECLREKIGNQSTVSDILYVQNTTAYNTLLNTSIRNPLFISPLVTRPQYIIAPKNESHVQASILCSRKHGLQIRVRSGGHDYEGLSYTSQERFIIIDLFNFRSIDINLDDRTASVQAGATLGELYYKINETSGVLGFPAGVCPTIGVGGHFSGGGIGLSMRKYGLSIDHIIDAYLVDADGKLHDRKSMGERVFWAIRGGGAASYGVVLSWKIKLVKVPPTVAVFTVTRSIQQDATKLVQSWQSVAPKLPKDIVIRVILSSGTGDNGPTVRASFNSLYLGRREDLLSLMETHFPELGLKIEDCNEMTWFESTMYFAGYPSAEAMLSRELPQRRPFKAASDFVKKPLSDSALWGLWNVLLKDSHGAVIFEPMGGRIKEIHPSATPFPHRAGNMYNIQYYINWDGEGTNGSEAHINWIRSVYGFMTPYVSKSPRTAYLNYRDLDLGQNHGPNTTYLDAKIWGLKYFKHNFKKLALVKASFDNTNFFRNEQSVPPLFV